MFVESWYACRNVPGSMRYVFKGLCVGMFRSVFGIRITKYVLNRLKISHEMSLNQRLAHDTMTNLITYLHYADHTSMAFSIESRMPFMDYRLIEFLASVPACYKIRRGWTKYLARVAFDGKLPDSINWRKDKMGWPIPEKKWFYGGLNSWFIKESQNSEIIDKLGCCRDKNIGFFPHKVKRLLLCLWYKTFIKSNAKILSI